MNVKNIILTGTELEIKISGQNCDIRNDGTETIYASNKPNITAGADGVVSIPAGGAVKCLDTRGAIFVKGTGAATCVGNDYSTPVFKVAAAAGGKDTVAREEIADVNEKVDVLNSRINNLSSLGEGSTTGDAELVDIRVGADGTLYENAGMAVRKQVGELKENLAKYKCIYNKSFFDENYSLLLGSSWILGSIRNGHTTNVNNRIRTEIIDISNMPNEFIVNVEDGYMWNFYDFDNIYAGLEWKNGGLFSWSQHGNPKRVAFLVKKSDDSEITDIDEVSSKIRIEFPLFDDFYRDRNVITENTSLYTCLDNGCYGCNSSVIDTIPDKPDFITSGFILFVNNVKYSDGNSFIKVQHICDRKGNHGFRMITANGVADEWICLHKQENKEKLISIGDSIPLGTWSWLDDEGYQHTLVDESISYVQVMCDILGLENLNYCHGGLGWLRNANDGTALKPLLDTINFTSVKTVFIQLGTNDWNYNFTLGEITDTKDIESVCGGVRYTIEYIMEHNPLVKLCIVSPFNRAPYGSSYKYNWGYGGYNNSHLTLKNYCDAIKSICEEYGVQYIDCTLNSAIGRLNIKSMCPDGTHPSIEAHNILGHEFAGRYPFK